MGWLFGSDEDLRDCPNCNGTGKDGEDMCNRCSGEGVVRKRKKYGED